MRVSVLHPAERPSVERQFPADDLDHQRLDIVGIDTGTRSRVGPTIRRQRVAIVPDRQKNHSHDT
jgi:hypothetical protein